MSAIHTFLERHLRDKIKPEDKEAFIDYLCPLLVLKEDYNKMKTSLEKQLKQSQKAVQSQLAKMNQKIKATEQELDEERKQMTKLYLVMAEQTKKIQELTSIRRQLSGEFSPDSEENDEEEDCATASCKAMYREESDAETAVKTIENKLQETEEVMSSTDNDHQNILKKITEIKLKIGLKEDATMEELEEKFRQITLKKKHDSKELQNLKEKLEVQKEKLLKSEDKISELEEEKKFLEKKLENKTRELGRIRCMKDTKKTIKVADNVLSRFYKRRDPQHDIGLAVAQAVPRQNFTTQCNDNRNILQLSRVGGPEPQTTCAKCNKQLMSTIYCEECVKCTLYK